MESQLSTRGWSSKNHWMRIPRSLVAFLAGMALMPAASARALTPVELTKNLEQYANDIAAKVKGLKTADLQAADDDKEKCNPSIAFQDAKDDDLNKCRTAIGSAWRDSARAAIEETLAKQEDTLKKTKESQGAALADLNVALRERREAILESLGTATGTRAKKLGVKTSGTLNSWLDDEKILSGLADALADVAKAAAHKADKGVIEAFVPKAPADADLIAELEEARERLLAASEQAYQRTVNCSLNSATDSLTCSPGLLLSGEEPSDVLIEGLPAGKKFTVTALLTEQQIAGAQKIENDTKMRGFTSQFGEGAAQRLDVDQECFEGSEAYPVVVEVHTDRWFAPTHGGGSRLRPAFRRAKYWSRVAARLRDESVYERGNCSPTARKLTLVSKGTAPRLHIAIAIEGAPKTVVASIPLGYARWKFESGGFLGGSSVVDQEVRSHPDPADSTRVIVEDIRYVDKYSMETGVLANFVPQNYQAVGFALGFATNEGRAPSVYLGANLRVRTFGQQGLASVGLGYLWKSVTRFPALEEALDDDRGIAADSSLLQGDDRFEGGVAVIISLGFSFGPIGGGGSEAKK